MTRQPNVAADLLDHVSNPLPCAERDKQNHQPILEIFDRLVNFDNESVRTESSISLSLHRDGFIEQDRPVFCQRLQLIWQEQGICCQSYPTITNQILDLYKLHRLVQEKQGYLEITTNRGWKEISTVLGFGDSGRISEHVSTIWRIFAPRFGCIQCEKKLRSIGSLGVWMSLWSSRNRSPFGDRTIGDATHRTVDQWWRSFLLRSTFPCIDQEKEAREPCGVIINSTSDCQGE